MYRNVYLIHPCTSLKRVVQPERVQKLLNVSLRGSTGSTSAMDSMVAEVECGFVVKISGFLRIRENGASPHLLGQLVVTQLIWLVVWNMF